MKRTDQRLTELCREEPRLYRMVMDYICSRQSDADIVELVRSTAQDGAGVSRPALKDERMCAACDASATPYDQQCDTCFLSNVVWELKIRHFLRLLGRNLHCLPANTEVAPAAAPPDAGNSCQ